LHPEPSDLLITYQLKGDIFYAQGQLDKALESFQKSLDLNPSVAYAIHPYCQKALILSQLGRFQEALDTCEYASMLYPHRAEFYNLKLRIQASLNLGG